MPRRLLFALLLLVAAPLVLLGWLSASAYQQQQRQAREQLTQFFQSRLAEIDRSLLEVFESYQRSLRSRLDGRADTIAALRELELETPIVRSGIFVNESGMLIHPSKPQPEQAEKVALFAALPAIISSRPDLGPKAIQQIAAEGPPSKQSITQKAAPPSQSMRPVKRIVGEGKWQVWYMDEGVQLIYWMRLNDGSATGVLLERARWISDLTTQLPDTIALSNGEQISDEVRLKDDLQGKQQSSLSDPIPSSGFTALTDEAKRIVYRWGADGSSQQSPLAARNLSPPLTSWQLEYHSRDPLAGAPSTAFLVASIAGVGVVLLSLGIYVLTAVQRQMRSARQRVSFASQVSHELRTPLTNIRLYAELAEVDLEQLPQGSSRDSLGRRLNVIDTESRRLGRLVSGVLEMIRDPNKQRQPRITPAIPDEVIEHTLTQFAPSFEKSGLSDERELNAIETVGMDVDILELILVNLFSNVEKYAAEGGRLIVSSKFENGRLTVDVSDHGPGIPWHQRNRVFRPFIRLDDSIQAPSGTGIGLTIARQLARRHGGDLELTQGSHHRGACFRLSIETQPIYNASRDANV
ncbi:MAG: HAMP domain-containing sensor histidine kinase [Planctomycetota bacterium]